MTILARGRYRAFEAGGPGELAAARALRAAAFPADRGGGDGHDARCRHMLVEDVGSGEAVCTWRALPLAGGAAVEASYAARFYGLNALAALDFPMLEVGRFCIRKGVPDADVLRVAWGALARQAAAARVGMVFGCVSFSGTNPEAYRGAFGLLAERYLAPAAWAPEVKAADAVPLARRREGRADPGRAMAEMPSILRSYLAMGGRVSDHAVIDEEMGTLHVFTGIDVAAMPPGRRKWLRAVAG